MLTFEFTDYNSEMLKNVSQLPSEFGLYDHLNGFDINQKNELLSQLDESAGLNQQQLTLHTCYMFDDCIKSKYKNLNFKFSKKETEQLYQTLRSYTAHPPLDYKNFVCSFNGSPHVSRKLLVSIIQKFGWFNPNYSSKNFSFTENTINGYIKDYVDDERFYSKFFSTDQEFLSTTYSFGHVRFFHRENVERLEKKLTESFLHLFSESLATSYYPFVSEKFFYSVVTRGLFLSYAQPGWHSHIEKYLGFKKYVKIFDYKFDTIENPIERLLELITMISKFSVLSVADWNDLYHIEQDTIEYNYNHYFSGRYLECLKKYE